MLGDLTRPWVHTEKAPSSLNDCTILKTYIVEAGTRNVSALKQVYQDPKVMWNSKAANNNLVSEEGDFVGCNNDLH